MKKDRPELKRDDRFLQDYTNRYLANLLVRKIAPTNIRPNQITYFSLLLGFLSSCLIVWGKPVAILFAALILFLSLVLDSADGQLARLRKQSSNFGNWLDKVTDRIKESTIITALAYLVGHRFPQTELWVLGPVAIFLVNFMYYNLELLERSFTPRALSFPFKSRILRNLISFGYGERVIYLSILLAINQPQFALWLIIIGCSLHIMVNIYSAIRYGKV